MKIDNIIHNNTAITAAPEYGVRSSIAPRTGFRANFRFGRHQNYKPYLKKPKVKNQKSASSGTDGPNKSKTESKSGSIGEDEGEVYTQAISLNLRIFSLEFLVIKMFKKKKTEILCFNIYVYVNS